MRQLPSPANALRRSKVLRAGYTKGVAAGRAAKSRLNAYVAARAAADDGPSITPQHLSLLDGRTLNVCVLVPEGVDAVAARLLIGASSDPAPVPLTLTPRGAGRTPRATATAVLDLLDVDASTHTGTGAGAVTGAGAGSPLPSGLRRFLLAPGDWPLSVEFTTGTGAAERFALVDPPTLMPDGPNAPDPVRADGTYCRVTTTPTGRARISLGHDPAAAELISIDLGWTDLTLRGRLTGADEHQGATVELRLRGGGVTHRATPTWSGDRFSCTLDATAFGAVGTKEQVWDLVLKRPGHKAMRIARRRTDVREPKAVYRMPYRLLAAPGGNAFRVNPYYTPAGNLALRGALVATATGSPGSNR
ncbi:hypothetical protein [Streptomyces beihaiensis]|uniref:Uncharacterized protein n=1 Tax=Streptomyces beihaiensis TaxID=2984495 RepID=A0ABT3TRR3_9ACTN|nr:hypothetical protein [Streptomyces beihaiensis]MCX3059191.1 hypothetical protein [Streptomyces beihaiensis]